MAGYYNPYNFYPTTYSAPQYSYAQPNVSYVPQQPLSTLKPMEWVEGEVGAKAFQMPVGIQPNQPVPLWDTTDRFIYLKSWNPMGIPNPLQKIPYDMPEVTQQFALPAQSGDTQPVNFATKDDLESLHEEIRSLKDLLNASRNGNAYTNSNSASYNTNNASYNPNSTSHNANNLSSKNQNGGNYQQNRGGDK